MKKILFFLIGISFSVLSYPQNKTGTGNVTEMTGIAIPNAVVHMSPGSDTSIVYEYICDHHGNYSFDITSNDSVFILNILPSAQTLQFVFNEENIILSNGYNGILFHKVTTTNTNGIKFTIVDTSGNLIAGAKVLLYDTERKWRTDSCSIIKPVYTDLNGQIEISSLLPIKYWFNVRKGYMTNRFTIKNTGAAIDTASLTNITGTIRDLSQKEFYMSGLCDNKTWITDSMVIFGISQPYNADSKLLSDGTWFDSNGNHGYWWFNANETKMTYNYDTSSANGGGSTVEATLIELTDSTFAGDMVMFGMPVTYYMSVRYDTVNLNITAQDTVVYLDNNGEAEITPDDLNINSNYSFASDITLSQSVFGGSDTGSVDVYVRIEDRCGNSDTDTITITIEQPLSVNKMALPGLKMYPNPGKDYVVVEGSERIKKIEAFDILGVFVKQFTVNKEQFIINLSGLNHGIYLVRIYIADGIVVKKLTVE